MDGELEGGWGYGRGGGGGLWVERGGVLLFEQVRVTDGKTTETTETTALTLSEVVYSGVFYKNNFRASRST